MKVKVAIAIVANILGVAAPAFALYATFGAETAVDSSAVPHLLALAGSAVFAFVLGTFGGMLLRRSGEPDLIALLREFGNQNS